jgi:hypothetical protein
MHVTLPILHVHVIRNRSDGCSVGSNAHCIECYLACVATRHLFKNHHSCYINAVPTTCQLDVFALLVPSFLEQVWYSRDIKTMLHLHGWRYKSCNNIVISWLYRTCWNNLATSLTMSARLSQLLTSCPKLVDNLGRAVWTQPVGRLLQDVRFLRVKL